MDVGGRFYIAPPGRPLRLKPATKKTDAQVWKMYQDGVVPKDIALALNITYAQVSKGLYRERRKRRIPLQKRKGRYGTKGNKTEKRGRRHGG